MAVVSLILHISPRIDFCMYIFFVHYPLANSRSPAVLKCTHENYSAAIGSRQLTVDSIITKLPLFLHYNAGAMLSCHNSLERAYPVYNLNAEEWKEQEWNYLLGANSEIETTWRQKLETETF